jgi:hypothetical protein
MRRALWWTKAVVLSAFGLLVASNVLLPAVARAQWASAGGASAAQVLEALLGQTVTAERFVASAASGTAYACNAALASCVDLGPGALNHIGTNGSGDILLGDAAGNPTVGIGPSTRFTGNGTWTNTNGAFVCNNGCFIVDQFGTSPVDIDDADGLDINNTTPIKGVVMLSATIDIAAIGPGHCMPVIATVAGVEVNDRVFLSPNFDLSASAPNTTVSNARVTNAGTDQVTFTACDATGTGEDPASGSYLFLVIR